MRPILLIDFGSTYTKLTAVDCDVPCILGRAQAATTVTTDISEGLENALDLLAAQTGGIEYSVRLACSSAAGGLRMVACGLVPELTAKAAQYAAFGAGAKVIKTFAYELTAEDAREIAGIAPDILLLVGGTDGGNSEVVRKNAAVIAAIPGSFPVVYAGNRTAKAECMDVLSASSHPAYAAPNVMPSFGKLDVAPAQQIIRDIFLKRIVLAKGLSRFQGVLDGILMPTPSAVLRALTLLSEGLPGKPGIGELVAVDLGGATTDVYSIASGLPNDSSTMLRGLREPYVKRTVEGDIGMRYGALGVLEEAGMAELCAVSGLAAEKVETLLHALRQNPSHLPQNPDEEALDFALATLAIRAGLLRHAGTVEQVYTLVGAVYQQVGKDLRNVQRVLLTGGALTSRSDCDGVMCRAVAVQDPSVLIPRAFTVTVDRDYILSAMGLLADMEPDAAFALLYHHFGKEEHHGT
ncbi:MAG: MutL protein [Clostridiales bacterium]|nr:MutL protein [Clostridiales bacterium]